MEKPEPVASKLPRRGASPEPVAQPERAGGGAGAADAGSRQPLLDWAAASSSVQPPASSTMLRSSASL